MRERERPRSWPRVAVLLVLAALVLAGCLPVSVTTQGRVVNDLWNAFLVPAIVVAAIVWGLTTFAIVRYRRRSATAQEPPPQISGDHRFEIAWTAIPIATVLVLFWLTVGAVARMDERTPGGINVAITAFRWQWRFDYPDDGVSIVGLPDDPRRDGRAGRRAGPRHA